MLKGKTINNRKRKGRREEKKKGKTRNNRKRKVIERRKRKEW